MFKDSLTEQQYQNLLTHINGYIETLITEKTKDLNENVITQEMSILIASLIRENIVHHKYELSVDDIERIAEIVRLKLSAELNVRKQQSALPLKLSPDNVVEISNIIKQQQQASLIKSENPINIDEILLKILSSAKLSDLIDRQTNDKVSLANEKIQNQNKVINDLKIEIGGIKESIMAQLHGNVNLYESMIHQLNAEHIDLAKSLDGLRLENDDKLQKIRTEFDDKLLSLRKGIFALLDERIKIILSEILGYKSENIGDTVDIQKWIQNVFVAKNLLEEKLLALNDKFEGKLTEEINRSADILMAKIGQQIHRETIVLIEKNNEKFQADFVHNGKNGNLKTDLNEKDVQRIVKDALAIYDADKTGLVDYALETAGGEILSTR